MSVIDLHIHSNISGDGEFSPQELIRMGLAQNMRFMAIADHNSVRGIQKALDAAAAALTVIPAVELDCTCSGRNFHLLGYGFDYTRKEFAEIEQDIMTQEKNAAEEKVRLFRKATGIPISMTEVLTAAKDSVVTGELIAELLLSREDASRYPLLAPYQPGGAKSDMPNVRFYWDYFSEGKPAYVPIHYMSLPDAAALIHSAGGIAVLAHPGQNLPDRDPLIHGILTENIDGLEAFSSYHSRETAEYYHQIAKSHDLIVTCGSDFHGRHKPNIRLGGHGSCLSDADLMEEIHKWLPSH